jgi:hypothetical protein
MFSLKNIYENVCLNISYEFQNSMGPWKPRCDVPSGSTQGWACPFIKNALLKDVWHVNLLLIMGDV